MSTEQTVLVVGGTGRTGGRVLEQLLDRGVNVRAIVRSAQRLPNGVAEDSRLTVIEADLLSLTHEDLEEYVRGCDAVISCLGHVINLKGIFGPPRDLVVQATTRLCGAIRAAQPSVPVRFVLMSSVSVNHPSGCDSGRGALERAALWLIRVLVPPARDNQRASDFLVRDVGTEDPSVQWVVVRPDTLREGDVSPYALHEDIVSSLFHPDESNMANIAHFMCELAVNPNTFDEWKGKLPEIINCGESTG